MDKPSLKKEDKEKRLFSLPVDIVNLLLSNELSEKLIDISTKYNLTGDLKNKVFIKDFRVGKLIEIVIKTLKGELLLKDFNKTLEYELKIDSETTKKMSKEISKQIFSTIEESLKKIHKEKHLKDTPSQFFKEPFVKPEKKESDLYREQIK